MIEVRTASPDRGVMVSRAAVVAAYAYGILVAAGLGHFLLGIPIQLTDSFGNMLKLDVPWGELMRSEFSQRAPVGCALRCAARRQRGDQLPVHEEFDHEPRGGLFCRGHLRRGPAGAATVGSPHATCGGR